MSAFVEVREMSGNDFTDATSSVKQVDVSSHMCGFYEWRLMEDS